MSSPVASSSSAASSSAASNTTVYPEVNSNPHGLHMGRNTCLQRARRQEHVNEVSVTFSPPIFHFPPSNTSPQAPSPHQNPCTYTRLSHSLSHLIFILHLFLNLHSFDIKAKSFFYTRKIKNIITKQGSTAYSSSKPYPSHPRRKSPPPHYPTDSRDPR
jgi:hypothetical protein